jgi:hypothetical protein
MMAQLLEWLKPLKPQAVKNDKKLLGLFAGDADRIEPITESTIPERHHNQTPSQQAYAAAMQDYFNQTPSQQAYAAAMQDYLSRPAKPLKSSHESYPPREALYDRGNFC